MTADAGRAESSTGSEPKHREATPLSGLARGSSANLLGAIVYGCSGMLVTLIITRTVDPARAGAFFTATSVFAIALSIALLGTGSGLVYFVARSRALGHLEKIPLFFRAGIRPVLAAGLILGAGVFIWAPVIVGWLNTTNIEGAVTYVRACAPFIPLAAIESATLAGTQGLGRMRPTVLIEQVGRSSLQLVLVAAAAFALPPAMLGLGWAVPYLPAAIAALLCWRRGTQPLEDSIKQGAPQFAIDTPKDRIWRRFWAFSGPRAISGLAQQSMQRVDILLVAAMASPAAAAVYTAATRFIVLGQTGNRAISTAVQPRLAHSLAKNDIASAREYYRVGTSWLMLLTWPLYMALMVSGPTILTAFGAAYERGQVVLLILAVTMLWATSCGMVDMVLLMAGRASWNLINTVVSLMVNVGLDVYLIPRYSYSGAAFGWAAAIAVQNALALSQVKVSLDLHPFGRQTILAGFLPLLCFGAVPLLWRAILGPGWAVTIAALVAAGILYVCVLYVFREHLMLAQVRVIRKRAAA